MDGTSAIFTFMPSTSSTGGYEAGQPNVDDERPWLTVGDPKVRMRRGQSTTILFHGQAVDRCARRAVYWHDASGKAWGATHIVWQPVAPAGTESGGNGQ